MISLIADVNIQGQFDRIIDRMRSDEWREFWDFLELRSVSFTDLGLAREDTDDVVWKRCQEHRAILITNNRNDDGPDSLETAIRTLTESDSLPVFTIGDADRILSDADYAELTTERLYRYLLDLENLLGTGRHYIP